MIFCLHQNCQRRVSRDDVCNGNTDGECCLAADQGNILLFDGRYALSASNQLEFIHKSHGYNLTSKTSFR